MLTTTETTARAVEAMKPRTFTMNVLGRCKRCKRAYRRAVAVTVVYPPWRDGFPPPRAQRSERWPAAVECCGRAVLLEPVSGRKTATPCDERCTSATGHRCECSCGGRNHGADHD